MEWDGYRKIWDLRELWRLFVRHLGLLAAAAMAASAMLGIYQAATYEPMYGATATLYILRQEKEIPENAEVSEDFSLALKVVNDCTYLLKSHTVLDQVIRELELDMDYETLYDRISASNPDNTRILEVRAEASTPEQARMIVDRVCQLGRECITRAMGFEQVNLFEWGVAELEPCNRLHPGVYVLVGAAAAGVVYLILLAMAFGDDRIRSRGEIEQRLGLNVLAEVPDRRKKKTERQYDYGKEPGFREAIHTLRANVRFRGPAMNVIVVTSTGEQEGKTTVAMHLAESLAELGSQVLFLDGDLRRAGASVRFGETEGRMGLCQVLEARAQVWDCLQKGQTEGLSLLLAGGKKKEPLERLSGPAFGQVIRQARERFDYVIVDTPPIGCVVDAAVIAECCDGALMVIGDGTVRWRQVRDAVEQLGRSSCPIIGAVRNYCPDRDSYDYDMV